MDNLEEYRDALLYDMENPRIPELSFLVEWAERIGDPILDLACGTGRLTIPLAELEYEMTGVDIHEGMLQRAKQKAEEKSLDITWYLQDCTNLQLAQTYPLVLMVGSSFQHFLTNDSQEHLLRSIADVLSPEGIFIFDTRFPSAKELLEPPAISYKRTLCDPDGRVYDLYHQSEYNPLTQIQHHVVYRRYQESGKNVEEVVTRIDLRYTYPQEMERLLQSTGFNILYLNADWKQESIQSNSKRMVYVCQKKR